MSTPNTQAQVLSFFNSKTDAISFVKNTVDALTAPNVDRDKIILALSDLTKLVVHFTELLGKSTGHTGIVASSASLLTNLNILFDKWTGNKPITVGDVTGVLQEVVGIAGDLALLAPTPQTKALGISLKALSTYITYAGLVFGEKTLVDNQAKIADAGREAFTAAGVCTRTDADLFVMEQVGSTTRFVNSSVDGGDSVGYAISHQGEAEAVALRLKNNFEVVEGFELRTVKGGDTLSRIAAESGYTIAHLLAANPQITDKDRIYAGEVIRVPVAIGDGNASSAPAGIQVEAARFYVDAQFNTGDIIASVTGTTVAELQFANPDIDLGNIPVGTLLRLPSIGNGFDLAINTLSAAEREGAADPLAVADAVAGGLVSSGGGWRITTDPIKLNENNLVGGNRDNTANAAFTQILSDGWRPGNGNLAPAVIDIGMATNGAYGWGSMPMQLPSYGLTATPAQGIFINTANALAQFTLPTDPLVLDLDGNGVHLTSYGNRPVLFDIDNDGGSLEQTGWVSNEDGIVVIDRNGNGKIDHIGEMLSEYFGGASGAGGEAGEKRFRDGFAALKSLDSNDDDAFDSQDAAWHTVQVWIDANHDGKSWIDANGNDVKDAAESTELKTFAELGITRIDLRSAAQSGEVRDGNEILARGTFVQNGQVREALAANLLANPNGHTFSSSGTGTAVATQAGTGSSGTVAYVAGSDAGEVIDIGLKGVQNAVGGQGDDVIQGDDANNWIAGGIGNDALDGGAGDDVLLIDADDRSVQGGSGTDIAHVVGDKGVTLNLARSGIEIAQGGRGDDVLIGAGRNSVFISGGDGDDVLVGGAANDAINGDAGSDQIDGGAGNDVLRGHRGSDTIAGGAGDDLLDGGQDDDTLYGGTGNDILRGGTGDDVIDGGDGVDILELSGSYADYRFTRAAGGIWISDTVSGRDGTKFVRNVEKANFKDVSRVDIPGENDPGVENPLPVKDVLATNKMGQVLTRNGAQLIGKEQLLSNDIDWQGDSLEISQLFDVSGGTAVITQSGDILFTPDPRFQGVMGFKYTVTDARGNAAAVVVQPGTNQSAVMRAAVYLKTADIPLDPLVTDQWYLTEANVLPVWKDYTGKGIRIGQFEPGNRFAGTKEVLDYRHPDLKPNIDQGWLATAIPGRLAGEGAGGKFSNHATLVAGVMAAARNGEGGVGVAYDATVAGYWVGDGDASNLYQMVKFDVVNHSWGGSIPFAISNTAIPLGTFNNEYALAVIAGRRGLGTVIVTAAGNDREKGGNANYTSVTNTRAAIAVGAINASTDIGALQLGGRPFSNPGANLLVSAPGSNVLSTARFVANGNGSTFGAANDVVEGTSFAAPIVSGIIALMLEANPDLGWRDVQEILALSAKRVSDNDTDWVFNGASNWNGGGMHASHDYGFGEVDARAAVRLAETWVSQQTSANEYKLVQPVASGQLNQTIPDSAQNGISSTLNVNAGDLQIEHVEIRVNLTHQRPGDLILKLISPTGTESILMNRPGKNPVDAAASGDASFNGSDTLDFTFTTTRDWGETASGVWTLQVVDAATGSVGTLNSWSMTVTGKSGSKDDQYFYTDEYATLASAAGRNMLKDADEGFDTINVAALSSGSRVDLSAGSATIAGAGLSIQDADRIENLIGGEFNDTLIGNAAENVLVGGRGNDVMSAAEGVDVLFGGQGYDTLTGGGGSDFFVFEKEAGSGDTVTDFTLGVDRIVLSGFPENTVASIVLKQQGADTRIDLGQGQTILLRNVQAASLTTDHVLTVPDGISAREVIAANQFVFASDSAEQRLVLPDNAASLWAGNGDDQVYGGRYADVLHGGGGNDTLAGDLDTTDAGGNDTIYGESGDDVLRGGGGNDSLYGGNGLDLVNGDAGDDSIYLEGDEALDLLPSAALDHLGSNVIVQSGAAYARVWGGSGADRFVLVEDSSSGASHGLLRNLIDDFEVSNPNEKIDLSQIRAVRSFADLRFSTVTFDGQAYLRIWMGEMAAGTQYLTLRGITSEQLSAANFMFPDPYLSDMPVRARIGGTSNADVLIGDAGGNRIDGGPGADTMEGRTGDDTYVVDNSGDLVQELADGGYDSVQSSISYALGSEVEELALTGTTDIAGTGNAGGNRITGNAGNNVIDGGAGIDTMVGGAGNDTYFVDDGADAVVELAGQGTDGVRASVSYTLGNNVENLTLTGNADLGGTGNNLSNRIAGNSGRNHLFGFGGHDYLDGGAGSDLMVGGSGNDTYVVDEAGDVVVENAGEGVDSVEAALTFSLETLPDVEHLTLMGSGNFDGTGNAASNRLTGNSGANVLDGGAGNDDLDGGAGVDTMIGGTGDDTYVVDSVGDKVVEFAAQGVDTVRSSISFSLADKADLENLTLIGTQHVDATGNAGNNVLIGNSGANRLDAGAGDDYLDGGQGGDTLIGGDGNDIYVVDSVSDVVIELADGGWDQVRSAVSYTLADKDGLEDLTLTGTGNTNATGNAGANKLTGNTGSNRLDGGAGTDVMAGGAGDDTYVVDGLEDVVDERAGEGLDTIETHLGYSLANLANVENLTLTGSSSVDGTGNAADNRLVGNAANNTLSGGAGQDYLDGGMGADTLIGGVGNDVYVVDSADDVVVEQANEGTDSVFASIAYSLADKPNLEHLTLAGDAAIDGTGNAAANQLYGNTGANRLLGGDGNDTLVGGAGNDWLDGGTGADSMAGGTGDDTYVVDSLSDLITEGAGQGIDTVLSGVTFSIENQSGIENITLTGAGKADALGNALDNTLVGNSAANYLRGRGGDDRIAGGDGDDLLYGDDGKNVLNGDGGNDRLFAGDRGDVLAGGSGNDALSGGKGADTLDGGTGNDTISGGDGSDIYLFYRGVGSDRISESFVGGGIDTIKVMGDIRPEDIKVSRTQSDLILMLKGTSDVFTIGGWYGDDASKVERVEFPDGTVWTVADVRAAAAVLATEGSDTLYSENWSDRENVLDGLGGDDTLYGLGGADTLRGGTGTDVLWGDGGNDSLYGGAGNDRLYGDDGNDFLDGGSGYDDLNGGFGNDTYVFTRGMGQDSVFELSGTDAIQMEAGIRLADIVLARFQDTLILTLSGTEDAMSILGWYDGNRVETIRFADGTTWDATYLRERTVTPPTENADYWVGDATQDDVVETLAGDDRAYGYGGNDTLSGGAGNDSLFGGAGNDVLDGGVGNDRLDGGDGNDTYHFYLGAGQDTITDRDYTTGNIDTIRLGAGIGLNDVRLRREGSNLKLQIVGTTDALTISGWYDGSASQIERLVFAEGMTFDAAAMQSAVSSAATEDADVLSGGAGNDVLNGFGGDDQLSGNAGNDTLIGGSGADFLDGGAGDDLLDGGEGNDSMRGGAGNDTYLFYRGMGQDTILDIDWLAGNVDTVRMAAGIRPEDVKVTRGLEDLHFSLNGTDDTLTVSRWRDDTSDYWMERVVFENGVVWNTDDLIRLSAGVASESSETLFGNSAKGDSIDGLGGDDTIHGLAGDDRLNGGTGNDTLYGDAGADVLDGGAGNDLLDGGDGDDTYRMNRGMGQDTIQDRSFYSNTDTIKVDAGIAPADIAVTRDLNNLYLAISGTNDKLTLLRWSWGSDYKIERVVFADGTTWDADTLATMSAGTPTASMDVLYGDDAGADTLDALGGDDVVYGLAGDDSLMGGSGADKLYGGEGNDSLEGGADKDTLVGEAGDDRLFGGLDDDDLSGGAGDDVLVGGAGNDTLKGDVGNDRYRFDRGDDQDKIDDYDTTVGNVDVLQLGPDISSDQLWFRKVGTWDLEVSIIGTGDTVTISKWDFWSKGGNAEKAQHIEQFKTADGKVLLDSQVDQLVSAMAQFAPPPVGQTTLSVQQRESLMPVIASSWQSL